MGVELLGTYSADNVGDATNDEASINDVLGQINRERIFIFNDSKGKLNPYTPGGLFASRNWRNGSITETNALGRKIYDGVVNEVGWRDDGARQVVVTSRDQLAFFADLPVEELRLISDETFLTDYYKLTGVQDQGDVGSLAVTAVGAPADIPSPSLLAFGLRNVPRYAVTDATGSPTTSIKLDRGLELGELADIKLRVMAPKIDSPAALLRSAITGAGIQNRIGASFNYYHDLDTASSTLLWVNVQKGNDVRLLTHIKKILEMFDMYLSISVTTGQIDVFRGFQYTGNKIALDVTDSEVLETAELNDSKVNHTYGYYTLFVSGSGGVEIAQGTTTAANLDRWAPLKNFIPVDGKANSILEYQYLYANEATAHAMGARRVSYYGVPRVHFGGGLKLHMAGKPKALYNLALGKEVLLTITTSTGRKLSREPARCTAFSTDQRELRYASVEFELTNYRYPALPVV